ncbi:acetylornithine deacetylase [Candidatus Thalassolituus haligoni]|uniref:acetylornithine deacetylase n=1 Tax=Candidatus Thalassolituus haligoni TaxID=3100113 RepID=UPI0035125EE3|tara:strand:- start:1628 stop:2809 length:1182 start_codon:yes stop_codon:yes gene_type:complete
MATALTRTLLETLIGFDTTSVHSNLALMHFIQNYLQQHGVDSTLIHDESGEKANLYTTIGPQDIPGVMLSGHTDTVPVAGQHWHFPPFELTAQQGRWYGRGTTDMKGFIAVVLAAVPDMVKQPLVMPIHLAFSYDEEIGCLGVRRLIDTVQTLPIQPAMAIIGEPTSMQIVTAHKGKLAGKVTVTGKACHSGMAPLGVNAVNYAARMVVWLEQLARDKQHNGPFADGYEIPFTTVHTGTIQGGTALNIVPDHCEFVFEFRNIATESPQDLLALFKQYANELQQEMQALDTGCRIDCRMTSEYPGLTTASDADVIHFVRQLTDQPGLHTINFGTEGGLFCQALGIPTVVCGPGSMDQGHKPDEFVEAAQLAQCEVMMQRLVALLAEQAVSSQAD